MSRGAGSPRRTEELEALAGGVLASDPRSVGRAISWVEDGHPRRRALVQRLHEHTGSARLVGITGPPGAGKSTLVRGLTRLLRARGARVGILAVDPTSPFSGGALLGDRVRMQELFTDPGVFIRSMATRGAMGGLALAAHDAVDVLEAAGFEWILLETVGVGQDEVDVVRSVDSVLLVTMPGLGDDIQAIKAGIMEIADVFVLNKADREGAERTERDLEMMLALSEGEGWRPPIVRTVASRGEGLEELLEALEAHRRWLEESGELERRRRGHLRLRVENELKARVVETAEKLLELQAEVERAFADGTDPYRVAEKLFAGMVALEASGPGGEGR